MSFEDEDKGIFSKIKGMAPEEIIENFKIIQMSVDVHGSLENLQSHILDVKKQLGDFYFAIEQLKKGNGNES